MAPQWMPQNLQKRLFAYILQQLSLFSEIDLSKLDVSLGSSSQVSLKDVQLDTEALQIPGIFVRNGSIKNLQLQLNMSGGVNLDGDGLHLTIALASSTYNINDKTKFSLAQSAVNLANSMIEGEFNETDLVDEVPESEEQNERSGDQDQKQESTLNNVMKKAVDAALARLQVALSNVSIKIVMDEATMDLNIGTFSLETVDGVRHTRLTDLMLLGLKPFTDPGEFETSEIVNPDTEGQSRASNDDSVNTSEFEDNVEEEEEEEEEEEDSDDAYVEDDPMTSSSILEKPRNLTESLVYSKEEASSIYMSATSNMLQSERTKDQTREQKSNIAFINEIDLFFTGISSIENLKIEIDQIRIASTPIPPLILHILESLAQLGSKEMYSRNSNLNKKLFQNKRSNENHDNINSKVEKDDPVFDNLKINRMEVNFVSAILDNGSFSKPESLRLVASILHSESKDGALLFGGIQNLELLIDENRSLMHFDNDDDDDTKNAIRFELKLERRDFTLLFPNNVEIILNNYAIQKFINLTSLLPQILESFNKLNASRPIKKVAKSSIIVQTSFINVIFDLDPGTKSELSLNLYPISYESSEGKLTINKIAMTRTIDNVRSSLLQLAKLEFRMHSAEKQMRSFDSNGHEIVLSTLHFLKIDKIDITDDLNLLKSFVDCIQSSFGSLVFPEEEVRFKTRKKARISGSVIFKQKQSVKLILNINTVNFKLNRIAPTFGDINTSFSDITLIVLKENHCQIYCMDIKIQRELGSLKEVFLSILNPNDRGSPVVFMKIREPKTINVLLRNVVFEYYTKWLAEFDNSQEKKEKDDLSLRSAEGSDIDLSIKLAFSDCAVGLNPGRLTSKASLVIRNGNLDLIFMKKQLNVKSNFGSSVLVLIDDVKNIEDYRARRSFNNRLLWSQLSYMTGIGYSSVAKLDRIFIEAVIRNDDFVNKGNSSNATVDIKSLIDISIGVENLDLELCADSFQCLIQLINDLKQPVYISNNLKYKSRRSEDVNVFADVESEAFKSPGKYDGINGDSDLHPFEDLNFVENYYNIHGEEDVCSNDGTEAEEEVPDNVDEDDNVNDILDKDLNELTLDDSKENTLESNPFFTKSNGNALWESVLVESKSEQSDSILLFNEDHFEETSEPKGPATIEKVYPFALLFNVSKVTIKIFDGYDWKYTRKTISNCVKQLEKKVSEEQARRTQAQIPLTRATTPQNQESSDGDIIGETLFDSIHVSIPVTSDPSKLTLSINRDLQTVEDNLEGKKDIGPSGIEVGKTNIRKLKLRRSKVDKILIELSNVDVEFKMVSNFDPMSSISESDDVQIEDEESEIVNEINIKVADFVVIDKVPTSTWNKFVTLMRDINREADSSMFSMSIQTIRPISSLPATELVIDVNVLPLRLHVDQDTLELLIRFGEFKDSRFALIDDVEDIIYIERFKINAVEVKLDYKPKKVDYTGLRSGHTTELMNFFILDEASMTLKGVILYGISGFPRLGQMLNGLWMPDIKSTQLSGVLSGLAPVRSIVQIGSDFKDLVAIPIQEYQKDGRIYRGISKGVQQFTRATTNEFLKLGVKLAAGTQTILENTEEILGGAGSSARLADIRRGDFEESNPNERNYLADIEEEEEEGDFDDLMSPNPGAGSQLIGRSSLSTTPLQHSIYQPTLESFVEAGRAVTSPRNKKHRRRKTDKYSLIDDQGLLEQDGDDDEEHDEDLPHTISLYANQPNNLREGVQLAYDSLGRNFLVAREAIFNAYTDMSEGDNAHERTLAIVRAAPVAFIRPVIGATEAVSKTLLGITNQLDPEQLKYTKDKYKEVPRNHDP